jgi:hypothetical protein
MKNKIFKKLFRFYILKRIYQERLGEPIIYNLVSIFVFLFGNFRSKVKYDLVPREAYAYGILSAADYAKENNIKKITIIEFGVAAGNGLLNMCYIADKVNKLTGVEFQILGFDTGAGMPPPVDYKDHPEKYFTGDFPPIDSQKLVNSLPSNAKLILGNISDSIIDFDNYCNSPIGFVSVDVDYYTSTIDCLKVFNLSSDKYLPYVFTYFDDVYNIDHNEFCGELLAINEFNLKNDNRKVTKARLLNSSRIFRRSPWTHQIYLTHIFDHKHRTVDYIKKNRDEVTVLGNPFL